MVLTMAGDAQSIEAKGQVSRNAQSWETDLQLTCEASDKQQRAWLTPSGCSGDTCESKPQPRLLDRVNFCERGSLPV